MKTEQELRVQISLIAKEILNKVDFWENPFAVSKNYRLTPVSQWLNENEALLVVDANSNYEIFPNTQYPNLKKENIKNIFMFISQEKFYYLAELKDHGIYSVRLLRTTSSTIALRIQRKMYKNFDKFLNRLNPALTFLTQLQLENKAEKLNAKRKAFCNAFMGKPPIQNPESLFQIALFSVFKNRLYKNANLPAEINERLYRLESRAAKILTIKKRLATAIYESTEELEEQPPTLILEEIIVPNNSDSQYFDLVVKEFDEYGEDCRILDQILKINTKNNICLLFEPISLNCYNEFQTMRRIEDIIKKFSTVQIKLLPNSAKPLQEIYDSTAEQNITALSLT